MGKATLAKQRAQGLIDQGRVDKLYDEGKLVVLFADDYERLKERLATLEQENKTLREMTGDIADLYGVTVEVLRGAMGTR